MTKITPSETGSLHKKCFAFYIINGDYFKRFSTYNQMRDICIKAFSSAHKQGPLTWLFRMAERLLKGMPTVPFAQAIDTTGSISNDVSLNLRATKWVEDNDTIPLESAERLFTYLEFLLLVKAPVFIKLRDKDSLIPDLSICEFGIQHPHLQAITYLSRVSPRGTCPLIVTTHFPILSCRTRTAA